MGFLDKIFKGSEEEEKAETSKTPWNDLQTELDLHQLEDESKEKVVVIFKHSTRCGISRMAKRQFEGGYKYSEKKVKLYLLDLIAHREISNAIAEKFGVIHESPQMLILKDKKVVHQASHSAIDSSSIDQFTY